ncbi:hypothetical protein [Microbulbifer hydrolyticus]|uniref:Gas vesicle protein n=1 Tax=Microbulbifer hydrolyticus TaxID=48074 RepID=A0A6P1TEE0_9GAMM|nr:hypothetical protein [Microbulbifer hydrolyticus]MBB5213001.1 gas vesicle protein [Microbulbifer hydrolyticus]QHQ40367.1 hypothetical protein GTQ55_16235 [Microbulbifer hydrolyticus]
MKLRHLTATAFATFAFLLSACSGPETPQQVTVAFWDAAIRDDMSGAVRYSTLDSVERYDAFSVEWDSYQPKWGKVVIDGDEASVAVELSSPERGRIRSFTTYLVQRDGEWLVDYERTAMSINGGVFGDLLSKFDLFRKDLSKQFERSADEAGIQMDQMLEELESSGKEMSEQASEALEVYSEELQRTLEALDESLQRTLEERKNRPSESEPSEAESAPVLI